MIGASLLLLVLVAGRPARRLDGGAAARAAGRLHRVPGRAVARARPARPRASTPRSLPRQRRAPGTATGPVQLLLIAVGPRAAGARLELAGRRGGRASPRRWASSDLVIGLTIVAAGTSMPEVATSITAAIKGERDIAVGNVDRQQHLQHPGLPRACPGLASGGSGLRHGAVAAELRHLGDAGGRRWPACRCS
ncbi:MAG: hypothetical protein MZW92_59160 [Comamonadaceae bacterium]|nr:hypothetical protein [Comamonadaceae bacterium]